MLNPDNKKKTGLILFSCLTPGRDGITREESGEGKAETRADPKGIEGGLTEELL